MCIRKIGMGIPVEPAQPCRPGLCSSGGRRWGMILSTRGRGLCPWATAHKPGKRSLRRNRSSVASAWFISLLFHSGSGSATEKPFTGSLKTKLALTVKGSTASAKAPSWLGADWGDPGTPPCLRRDRAVLKRHVSHSACSLQWNSSGGW